jgi:type II secretory ATPase GspE/PulE/Tfp pilus assembly ATPase PilB-like protein
VVSLRPLAWGKLVECSPVGDPRDARGLSASEREPAGPGGPRPEGRAETPAPPPAPSGSRVPIRRWLEAQPLPALEDAAEMQRLRRARLGDLMVESGLAGRADVDMAIARQRAENGKRLGEVMVESGLLTEADLARALAAKFQLPLVDLDEVDADPTAMQELPQELVKRHGILPLDVDAKALTVAIADPEATDVIDMLRLQSKRRIRIVLARASQLRRALEGARPPAPGSTLPSPATRRPAEPAGEASRDREDVAVRIVNQLIQTAVQRGASDVHIEPRGDDEPVLVRYRIDGQCVPAPDIAARHRSALTVRIKVMANLDIAERRRPQDGKLRLQTPDGGTVDVRVTTIPTIDDNEDVVFRILSGSRAVAFDELLLSEENEAAVRSWMRLDHGLVLCVGPTGVGKTTTVHGMLSLLDTKALKVWTAEDPVEIVAPGLRQVHVQPKIDLTFAAALRTFLRADPDVIMIGEMRDLETAHLALEASLTGHLVLSTLHTKSAPDTVARLLDMGLDAFAVADALSGVLSQRLVRRLCERCKSAAPATVVEIEALERLFGADVVARARAAGPLQTWRASGCEACGRSGYRGRLALHEVLTIDDEVRPLVARRAASDELRAVVARRRGTLGEDGLRKALAGRTDLSEVLAVTTQ